MFDIILPKETEVVTRVDSSVATGLIIDGLKLDCIDDVHSAVEFVNELTPVDIIVNGGSVEGILSKLVKELTKMSSDADVMAKDGSTVTEMANAITGVYFSFDDIKEFKIELYGSVIAWKASVQQEMA